MSPRIGIYAGAGTSHSWLWFVELCHHYGLSQVTFFDEKRAQRPGGLDVDVLVISGGDTFAVAAALGAKGAGNILGFVEQGGVYIGSCAGAYLPMNSSKQDLNRFNFVGVKITNLSRSLPDIHKMRHKAYACYGCDYIFHPVREEVTLRTRQSGVGGEVATFQAPLYGGPGMIAPAPETILATYAGFTRKTVCLVDRALAAETLIGHAAAVRVPKGRGCLYLFGPHFEHPFFPQANDFLVRSLLQEKIRSHSRPVRTHDSGPETETLIEGREVQGFLKELKRELSNSRVVAFGLEFRPLSWLIGNKLYDPEKIRVYVETLWKKLPVLDRQLTLVGSRASLQSMVTSARALTKQLRALKQDADRELETTPQAAEIFVLLNQLATVFFELFFRTLNFENGEDH